MKHSLTSPGPIPALFDLLAAGLAGNAAGRSPSSAPGASPRRSWLERIDHALWRSRQKETERYLAGSADLADLEARLRRMERRAFHRYT